MIAPFADAARLYAVGDDPAAEASCRAVLQQDPGHFDALHLLGVLLTRQQRAAEAVPYLRQAAAARAEPLVRVNLANALLADRQFEAAARVSTDQTPPALNNLGLARRGLEQHEAAAAAFRRATQLQFDYAPAWFNLAVSLSHLGRLEEALHAATMALRVAPIDTRPSRIAAATNEYGRILMALGRPEEALAECRRFLRAYPPDGSVLWNMSLCLLLLGEFAEGWAAYEHRFDVAEHDDRPTGTVVLDPGAVAGRTVLILTEQGRGDMLQFIRYVRPLAARGARVVVQAYPDLLPLLAAMPEVDSVVSTEDDRPEADLATPVMSLPLAFGGAIPAEVPYLRVPADRGASLPPTTRRRIGLVWSGSLHSYQRSAMPLAALAPLLAVGGHEFHALQRDIRPEDQAWLTASQPNLTVHGPALRDFADTAALIALMDLVISIDTAVAHLAGGLGKPVWILLPFAPDWRWQRERTDSPWYPTARLFRQPARGAWNPVVQTVIESLAGLN